MGERRSLFWKATANMVRSGWDPALAYTSLLSDVVRNRKKKVTDKVLREIGAGVQFFKGVPGFFEELKQFTKQIPEFVKVGIELEYYVITGGLEELVKGSAIAPFVADIFGCRFEVDPKDGLRPKTVMSFTDKTRYVFGINKGISGKNLRTSPYSVNDAVPEYMRRIPLDNMIYIGDGPTDIPCFSLIAKAGGIGIGVYKRGSSRKGYELARGKRTTIGPYKADYSKGTDLRHGIQNAVRDIGFRIVNQSGISVRAAPDF